MGRGAVSPSAKSPQSASGGPPERTTDIVLCAFYDGRLSLQIFDEGKSWFSGEADYSDVAHQKSTINGYIYGNNDAFHMKVGDKVRWYLFAVGGQTGLHTPHFHAATVLEYGRWSILHPASSYWQEIHSIFLGGRGGGGKLKPTP